MRRPDTVTSVSTWTRNFAAANAVSYGDEPGTAPTIDSGPSLVRDFQVVRYRWRETMKSIQNLSLILLSLFLIGACASSGSPAARGYEIRVRYAEVTEVNRVQLPSAAPAGAIVGGFTGLVLSSGKSTGRQVASGIGGAAIGGLATRALEGDRLGYSYTLRFADGSLSSFITEKGYMRVGDCVVVERGQYANIRRVAPVLCEGGPSVAIDRSHVEDARLCHEAKEQLLAARSDAEIDAASRKVSIICQY